MRLRNVPVVVFLCVLYSCAPKKPEPPRPTTLPGVLGVLADHGIPYRISRDLRTVYVMRDTAVVAVIHVGLSPDTSILYGAP